MTDANLMRALALLALGNPRANIEGAAILELAQLRIEELEKREADTGREQDG